MTRDLTTTDFRRLLAALAEAWNTRQTDAALACFMPDAVYMEPPDAQLFAGHEQLRPYFDSISHGAVMILHHVWFDEETQIGSCEFSFGIKENPVDDHGMGVAILRSGRIAHWREYIQKGLVNFTDFVAVDGKDWKWHIGNYG